MYKLDRHGENKSFKKWENDDNRMLVCGLTSFIIPFSASDLICPFLAFAVWSHETAVARFEVDELRRHHISRITHCSS